MPTLDNGQIYDHGVLGGHGTQADLFDLRIAGKQRYLGPSTRTGEQQPGDGSQANHRRTIPDGLFAGGMVSPIC
jgi:hypothetical protein